MVEGGLVMMYKLSQSSSDAMTRSRCEEILESFELSELEICFKILEHALKQGNPNYEPINLSDMEIDISKAKNKRSAFPK